MTAKVTYEGALRTTCKHIQSGNTFQTDAPTDNQGLGQAFSPTDTVATGLASCMLTVMGIKARDLDVNLKGATAEVIKHMASNPRRISKIEVKLELPSQVTDKDKTILERTGHTCPIHYSLHPDIEKVIEFHWVK